MLVVKKMKEKNTRREFLRKGLTVAAVGVTVPSFLTRTAYALNNPADLPLVKSRPGIPDDRILVVLVGFQKLQQLLFVVIPRSNAVGRLLGSGFCLGN